MSLTTWITGVGFDKDVFLCAFPFFESRYDVEFSYKPGIGSDILFFGLLEPNGGLADCRLDGRFEWRMPEIGGGLVKVFLTEECFDPDMKHCDFAISHSVLVNHANHLRLPHWAYPGWGAARQLIKPDDVDWEGVAASKTRFCNFVYFHVVNWRDDLFRRLDSKRHVDAPGRCMNNMHMLGSRWDSDWVQKKLDFLPPYKFTLAIESDIWPGYQTEKIMHPMLMNSVPIYWGDPLARNDFNTKSYVDITDFRNIEEMIDYVIAVDDNPVLYADMLAEPWFNSNQPPQFTDESRIIKFFDRIVAEAEARK